MPDSPTPRVLIADDQILLRDRVISLLRGFQVVGTTTNGKDLISEALRLQPDLIVTDITMPVLTGIDAAHELRKAGSTAKVVFLTVHREQEFVNACLAEGALGYVTKARLRTDLIPAINEALSGRRFVSPGIAY